MKDTVGEVVNETRYTRTVAREYDSTTGASHNIQTKRCALCGTPREEFYRGDLARHLTFDCEEVLGDE